MLYLNSLFGMSLCIIITTYAGFIQDKLLEGLVMHLERLDAQCRGKNVPHRGFFQGVKTESTKILIANYTLIIKEGSSRKPMFTIKIDRCRSKENLDSCEQYMEHPNVDYCKTVNPNNVIARKSPFYIPLEPTPKCPIEKGIYHANNFTFDLAPFIFFKLEGWHWKVTTQSFSDGENKLLFCMVMEGYVTKSKSKTN